MKLLRVFSISLAAALWIPPLLMGVMVGAMVHMLGWSRPLELLNDMAATVAGELEAEMDAALRSLHPPR